MKVLFVMELRPAAGSIQAVANYVRAGDGLGHVFAVYGRPDARFPDVRFSTEVASFDHVVFIVESSLSWLRPLNLLHILSSVPRHRRAILDADGMYNDRIVLEDYDRNHWTDRDWQEWRGMYRAIADRVLQPVLGPTGMANALAVPFYGYDGTNPVTRCDRKRYDLLHVGHNWWRWKELREKILPAIGRIRARLDGVCLLGLWWEDLGAGWDDVRRLAFVFEADLLRQFKVQTRPPVPYDQVIATMSQATINVMTQRPLLRHLRHLTSKYFEIFTADTIPLVMLSPDHAEQVYGPAGRELALDNGGIDARLLDVLDAPSKYREIVAEVRDHLGRHHTYPNRVRELIDALAF